MADSPVATTTKQPLSLLPHQRHRFAFMFVMKDTSPERPCAPSNCLTHRPGRVRPRRPHTTRIPAGALRRPSLPAHAPPVRHVRILVIVVTAVMTEAGILEGLRKSLPACLFL